MNLVQRMSLAFRKMVLEEEGHDDMLDVMLHDYDRAVSASPGSLAVHAAPDAARRHAFMHAERDFGMGLRGFAKLFPTLVKMQHAFLTSTRLAAHPHAETLADAPGLAEQSRAWAEELGAEAVGYCQVTPDLVFADNVVPYANAIVVAQRMDNDRIATAPSFDCQVEVMGTYASLGVLVNKLAQRIIGAGHDAVPMPALGGVLDYPALAERAGLGVYGRHGLLISPYNGAWQRIACVLTDVVLPTTSPVDDLAWVRDFCIHCGRCVRACPAGAIRETPRPRANGHASAIDGDSCLGYFSANYGCSVCIKVCPFTTVGYAALKDRADRMA